LVIGYAHVFIPILSVVIVSLSSVFCKTNFGLVCLLKLELNSALKIVNKRMRCLLNNENLLCFYRNYLNYVIEELKDPSRWLHLLLIIYLSARKIVTELLNIFTVFISSIVSRALLCSMVMGIAEDLLMVGDWYNMEGK